MHAEVHKDEDRGVSEFAEQVSRAGDESAARRAYGEGFNRLRSQLALYPVPGQGASATFESASRTVRTLAARCLPLGIAVAMHLYPLCVLQCVPLPLLSPARFKRALLLRAIRNRSLIVANAGSERSQGTDRTLVATPVADGVRIDGTYEYMSLASVADIVFFKAAMADSDHSVLCAADLRADSVRIGPWKFSGAMRLSDTSSATFISHLVPHGRYLLVPNGDGLKCISDYQRCWFHLFIADLYLARLEHLRHLWTLHQSTDHAVSLNELSRLREYSLHLLDRYSAGADAEPLMKTTSALKLRVSMMAQSTAVELRSLEVSTPPDAERLAADATELGFIKSQPTADERILRNLGAAPNVRVSKSLEAGRDAASSLFPLRLSERTERAIRPAFRSPT